MTGTKSSPSRPEDDGLLLASRLREARTTLGLTQQDMATALNVTRTAISAIENGDRRVSGLELRRLARLYRRPVAWLLGGKDPEIGEELTTATAHLTGHDQDAVLAFARFLAHQEVTR